MLLKHHSRLVLRGFRHCRRPNLDGLVIRRYHGRMGLFQYIHRSAREDHRFRHCHHRGRSNHLFHHCRGRLQRIPQALAHILNLD